MIGHRVTKLWMFVACVVFTTEAYPCSILGEISNVEMVKAADAIVRARAVEDAVATERYPLDDWNT